MKLIVVLQKIISLRRSIKNAVGGFIAAPSGISISYQTPKGWGYFWGANQVPTLYYDQNLLPLNSLVNMNLPILRSGNYRKSNSNWRFLDFASAGTCLT
jgi:hypothetical protein